MGFANRIFFVKKEHSDDNSRKKKYSSRRISQKRIEIWHDESAKSITGREEEKLFHNFAEDIAFLLIKNKVIDIEQRGVYICGIEMN